MNKDQSPSCCQTTKALRHNIIESLGSSPGDFEAQCHCLEPFLATQKKEACKILLHNLVQLTFPLENACQQWDAIITHAAAMQKDLKRKIGLATAACDYFSNIYPRLNNPRLIESAILESTLHSAHRDFLTGLMSRASFQDTLDQEISRAKRHSHDITLIFFDLNHFKAINDTHGHLAGDEALRQVGKILQTSKRKEDTACRFGGDEFVILLPETNKYMGLLVGKKLLDQINKLTILHGGVTISVSSCGGLASFPRDCDTGLDLIHCADLAMYQAKRSQRQELMVFSTEQRAHPRTITQDTITLLPLTRKGQNRRSSIAKNISQGGILLSCEHKHRIGTKLEIFLSSKEGKIQAMTGSVIRVEKIANDLYDIGLQFLPPDSCTDKNSVGNSPPPGADLTNIPV